VELILGRSSMTLRSLQIHPGVIDQDYMGELKILAQALQILAATAPTNKIAQLVLFHNIKKGKVLTPTPQGDKGFGHSDHAYWAQLVTVERLEMTLFLNSKKFLGLLNT
jgi:dUTPase